MSEELKPCPFCGGEAELSSDYSSERDRTRWSIWHECCEHEGEGAGYGRSLFPWFETPWYDTEAEAIAAWNTRTERTCRNTHENRWFLCSVCGQGFTDIYLVDEGDIDEQPRYCLNCGARVIA